jgi:hypothetical protein
MKPRDFYITVNEYGEPSHIALFEKLEDRKQIHAREVVIIDWNKLWEEFDRKTTNYPKDRIQQLVEKQLMGEE